MTFPMALSVSLGLVRKTSRVTPSERNKRPHQMSGLGTESRPLATSLPFGYDKRLMITAGRASRELRTSIAEKISINLTDADLKTFSDSEMYCRYSES